MRFNGRKQFAGAFGRSGLVKKSVYNKPVKANEKHQYGDDWSQQSARCKKRDDYRCQASKVGLPKCSNRFPPPLSHLLHAHHLVPWVKCKDNRLSNLVTLCLSCHERHHNKKIGCQQISKKQIEFSKKLR